MTLPPGVVVPLACTFAVKVIVEFAVMLVVDDVNTVVVSMFAAFTVIETAFESDPLNAAVPA